MRLAALYRGDETEPRLHIAVDGGFAPVDELAAGRPDLTGPSGTLTPSSSVNYTITVTNDGPDPAFSITITDELSPFTSFSFCNSESGSSCSASGNTVTFNINMLAPFATTTATVNVVGSSSAWARGVAGVATISSASAAAAASARTHRRA